MSMANVKKRILAERIDEVIDRALEDGRIVGTVALKGMSGSFIVELTEAVYG
ncbi:hypothetical protein [Saccharibacillus kuerlensis]|uniref:Uncharacterized protein n=1 Tax=Saccharibacillus kuerlensis TaxID=459527 RepID=A0ABQ2L5U7_9BACL|nr:hypothetical protein [Saccharibacillus kuerlensis]GGO04642.1 hypothetical protein GCM10010969_30070 [Saccharibacillus kuerlensis]